MPGPMSAVAYESAHNTVVIYLGRDIDHATATRVARDAREACRQARPGGHMLIDGRGKSFASLAAQRLLSSGSLDPGELPHIADFAVWVEAEHLDEPSAGTARLARFADPSAPGTPSWVGERHRANRRTLHIVAGSTGAGKSTYGGRLADDAGAYHASIDDWMQTLFGADRPDNARFDWYMERIGRCEQHMRALVARLHALGTPSVLDLGFTKAEHRARFLTWAGDAGIDCRMHFVDAPAERRWARVDHRNRHRGETFRLEVTRFMFDFVEDMFEPPTADEHNDFVHVWS